MPRLRKKVPKKEFMFLVGAETEVDPPLLSKDDHEIISFDEEDNPRELKVRLDKWLWAARFFKTRALARAAVESGNVLYDGQKANPNMEIQIGASIQMRQGRFEKFVIIKGLSTRRKNSDGALDLFEEMPTTDIFYNNHVNNYLAPNNYNHDHSHDHYRNQQNYYSAEHKTHRHNHNHQPYEYPHFPRVNRHPYYESNEESLRSSFGRRRGSSTIPTRSPVPQPHSPFDPTEATGQKTRFLRRSFGRKERENSKVYDYTFDD